MEVEYTRGTAVYAAAAAPAAAFAVGELNSGAAARCAYGLFIFVIYMPLLFCLVLVRVASCSIALHPMDGFDPGSVSVPTVLSCGGRRAWHDVLLESGNGKRRGRRLDKRYLHYFVVWYVLSVRDLVN